MKEPLEKRKVSSLDQRLKKKNQPGVRGGGGGKKIVGTEHFRVAQDTKREKRRGKRPEYCRVTRKTLHGRYRGRGLDL